MTNILKNGRNVFYHRDSPYKVQFSKGKYLVELYGASGGGKSGGHGGYSYGTLDLKESRILYLYIGGKGECNCNTNNIVVKGGFNGGGDASSINYQSSGGGGTDIRLTENDNYENRIIIAGGGGGDGDGCKVSSLKNNVFGGDGGGNEGGTSYGGSGAYSISYGGLYAKGGNQQNGGLTVKKGNKKNQDGDIGKGGMCVGGGSYCGAGGGGYYGGGGGFDVTGGGGGSGYINFDYFIDGMTNSSNYLGDGRIYITTLSILNTCQCSYHISKSFFYFVFINIQS